MSDELKTGQSVVSREDYETLKAERDQLRHRAETAERERDELRQQLDPDGTIFNTICCNGNKHHPFVGCLYCALEQAEKERDEARAKCAEISKWAGLLRGWLIAIGETIDRTTPEHLRPWIIAEELKKALETNPGQPLLDRLVKAEAALDALETQHKIVIDANIKNAARANRAEARIETLEQALGIFLDDRHLRHEWERVHGNPEYQAIPCQDKLCHLGRETLAAAKASGPEVGK